MVTSLIRPPEIRTLGNETARRVTWLELFFDLVFVAAVAQVGEPLGEHYTPEGLFRFGVLFLLIWWAWMGHATFCTRFDTDDLGQRLLTLLQMFAVAVMAANAGDALDSRSSAGFAAAYAMVRLVLVGQYVRVRRLAPARRLASWYIAGFGLAAGLWLVSSVTPVPYRFWLWGAAFLLDFATPLVAERLAVQAPIDPEHLPERFGLFTIVLLGESVVAVMHGMKTQEDWSLAAASSASMGLGLTFLVWWGYFHAAKGAGERPTRTPREARLFRLWNYVHIPLFLGIVVAGRGVEHVIATSTRGHLHAAEAWLLSGALAAIFMALTAIALTHPEERESASRRLPQLAIAFAALAAGAVGDRVSPAILIVSLTLLCLGHLLIAGRRRPAREPLPGAVTQAV